MKGTLRKMLVEMLMAALSFIQFNSLLEKLYNMRETDVILSLFLKIQVVRQFSFVFNSFPAEYFSPTGFFHGCEGKH